MGGQSDSRNDQVIGSRVCGSGTVRQLARKHDSTMYSNDLMHDLFNVMMLGIFSQHHQSLGPTISWSEVLEGDKPGSVCPCAYPGILLSVFCVFARTTLTVFTVQLFCAFPFFVSWLFLFGYQYQCEVIAWTPK